MCNFKVIAIDLGGCDKKGKENSKVDCLPPYKI